MPGLAETNLFDSLYDTLDRMDRVEGHKYIILVSTDFDTFSKINLDQITKKIRSTHDVTIFPISVGLACTGKVRGDGASGATWIRRSDFPDRLPPG
jgi:hypothetical protein